MSHQQTSPSSWAAGVNFDSKLCVLLARGGGKHRDLGLVAARKHGSGVGGCWQPAALGLLFSRHVRAGQKGGNSGETQIMGKANMRSQRKKRESKKRVTDALPAGRH